MGPGFFRAAAIGVLCLACVLIARVVEAQPLRGVVVDQTGLPRPGAIVQLRTGDAVIATVVTGADGTFAFPPEASGPTLAVSLDGVETSIIASTDASRCLSAATSAPA